MNITNDNTVMVFKREYQGNVFYSVGLSRKKQDGNYENGYMPCQFKKGVSVGNQEKIYIKKAWLSFYLKDTGAKNSKGEPITETKPYIFINEFTKLDAAINPVKEDPYKNFSEEVNITDADLPF